MTYRYTAGMCVMVPVSYSSTPVKCGGGATVDKQPNKGELAASHRESSTHMWMAPCFGAHKHTVRTIAKCHLLVLRVRNLGGFKDSETLILGIVVAGWLSFFLPSLLRIGSFPSLTSNAGVGLRS